MAKTEYGESRGGKGVEKTIPSKGESDSGAEPSLSAASGKLYSKAKRGAGGGDDALRSR